jgi:hypothetical protein
VATLDEEAIVPKVVIGVEAYELDEFTVSYSIVTAVGVIEKLESALDLSVPLVTFRVLLKKLD